MAVAMSVFMKPEHDDVALATIGGYVDTLGFVALFGMFTAHVTGNFVLLGADLVSQGQGVLLKLLAFPAFLVGVALSAVAIKYLPAAQSKHAARVLYLLQAFLLTAFLCIGQYAKPVSDPSAWAVLICGMVGACAMGVQNAHAKLIVRAGVPNTVMTGNVTQTVIDAIDLAGTAKDPAARVLQLKRFYRTLATVVGFALGAAAGALLYKGFAFWALALPIAALLAFAMRAPRA